MLYLYKTADKWLYKEIKGTKATKEEQRKLEQIFQAHTKEEIQGMMQTTLKKIVETQYNGDENLYTYLCQGIEDIAVEVKVAAEHGNLQFMSGFF